jgi:hypothetical protein
MHQAEHALKMTERFRELVDEAGDELPAHHYDQLRLIIDAGLDTALLEAMEKISGKLARMSNDILNDARFFN